MQLTLTAEWTAPTATATRLAIAGYTAVIETTSVVNITGTVVPAYEYTVLRDHFEIVATGTRTTRIAAEITVEEIIGEHAAGLSA